MDDHTLNLLFKDHDTVTLHQTARFLRLSCVALSHKLRRNGIITKGIHNKHDGHVLTRSDVRRLITL